jgi:dolichyl-phosphate beta-glucosyltransferase
MTSLDMAHRLPSASDTPSLSIVVPAFNEGLRIVKTIRTLIGHLPTLGVTWEVRVVNDGSTDDTASITSAIAGRDARVVLQDEPHRGKGGTVRAGMLAARGDLIFMCDADMSMPVHELNRFLDVVPSKFDIAIGSREGDGARRVGEPRYRHVMGRVFNGLVRYASGLNVNDTQCGFKMFTRKAAELVFRRVTIDGWAFDIEVLVIAKRQGLRVHEMPVEWHYRNLSRVSAVRDSLLMARDVLMVRANASRGRYES